MELGLLTILVVTALFALLAAGMPVAFSLLISGTLGLVLTDGAAVATSTLGRMPVSSTAMYTLVVIPMFMLMGAIAKNSGLAERSFDVLARVLRHVPGGLALATLAACAAFAAVSGSSIATVVTIGRTSVDEMTRMGYDRRFAAGIVGASGTLGILIPPSIAIILYGVLTGVSIGSLLIAGIIPGILSAVLYGSAIIWRVKRHPELIGQRAPVASTVRVGEGSGAVASGPGDEPSEATGGPSSRVASGRLDVGGLVRIAVLFVVVIGGIYSGTVTVIEAAAFGAFAALVMLVIDFIREPRELWRRFSGSLSETASLSGMVFALIIGAAVFTRFTVAAGIPQAFTRFATNLDLPPMLIVAILLLAFVPLGMFLDPLSILLIGVPIAYPVISALGFDGIWFGILVIKLIEVGMITPPVGLNAFVLSGTIDGLSTEDAFRGILWFLPIDLATIALIVAFPPIVTWLPTLLRGA